MSWKVKFTKKAEKQVNKLPPAQRTFLEALVQDIQKDGPVRGDWPNYSKLSDGSHHCHLSHRWVAVWHEEDGTLKIVEVTYAGSRKDAPY